MYSSVFTPETLHQVKYIPNMINIIMDIMYAINKVIPLPISSDHNVASFLDVVWYKNDKLVMNTENVKVRILDEENKTSLTVLKATPADEGTYVCKATSDIGLATSKAKLRVSGKLQKYFNFRGPEQLLLMSLSSTNRNLRCGGGGATGRSRGSYRRDTSAEKEEARDEKGQRNQREDKGSEGEGREEEGGRQRTSDFHRRN